MPRIPATSGYPDYQEIERDVKRLGPMTAQFGEYLATKRGIRRANGDKLPYEVRRSRGLLLIYDLIKNGEWSEADVARAVWRFHLDRAVAAERGEVTPYKNYFNR